MPDIAHNHRTPARFCAYVTELGQLTLAGSIDVGQNWCCKEVDFITICELGSLAGGISSTERNYTMMAVYQRDYQRNGYVQGVDVTDPTQLQVIANDFLDQNREFNKVTVETAFFTLFLH